MGKQLLVAWQLSLCDYDQENRLINVGTEGSAQLGLVWLRALPAITRESLRRFCASQWVWSGGVG